MNPSDAMPKDYGMYYDNCWMRHTKWGVGRIRIVDGRMWLDCLGDGSEPKNVKPQYLSCWWPRPGAFNAGRSAVYVARRAIRNMRKSAVNGDHYFVKWGNEYTRDIMCLLRDGPNFMGLPEAIEKLKSKAMSSVAITRDIIIHPEDKPIGPRYTVVFRGIEAGTMEDGIFEPLFAGNPLTNRVLRQLERSL